MQAFRAAFFLISDWKSCQDPVLECAQNIVNTDVFDRFHFFHFFMNFESSKLDFSDFLKLFGALRSLWDDLRDSLKHSGIQAEKLTFQGDPATGQVGGKLVVRGA